MRYYVFPGYLTYALEVDLLQAARPSSECPKESPVDSDLVRGTEATMALSRFLHA